MPLGGVVCSRIVCPKGHTIVLPRRIPSGIFQDQLRPPKGILTATFLCTECGAQFSCSPQDFRAHRLEQLGQGRLVPGLWHIAGECVVEHCEKLKPIYFGFDANGKEGVVRRHVFELIGEVECACGHRLQVRGEQWAGIISQVAVIPIARQGD